MDWPPTRPPSTAVAGIFAAKGRPAFNPLIAHVLDVRAARTQGEFSAGRRKAGGSFLARPAHPGPAGRSGLPGEPSCARGSRHARGSRSRSPAARALIEAAGTPLAAPSANRSGRVSPTTAAHVLADLDGRIDWILDGGPSRHGLESTIVACLDDADASASRRDRARGYRGGARTRLALAADSGKAPTAPGQLASHYAPRARVRLDARKRGPTKRCLILPARSRSGDGRPAGSFAVGRSRRGGLESVRLFARSG